MTRCTIERFALGAAAAVALLAAPAGVAFAGEGAATKRVTHDDVHREILLASADPPRRRPSGTTPTLNLDEKSGLVYIHQLKMGDRAFDFRIKGPLLRKQKAIGVRFKFRF